MLAVATVLAVSSCVVAFAITGFVEPPSDGVDDDPGFAIVATIGNSLLTQALFMLRYVFVFTVMLAQSAFAGDANQLTPVLAKPGKVHLQMDFEKDFVVGKDHKFFKVGQGTRWQAKNGMLVGNESSPEYQAKKKKTGKGHLGTAPRLQFPNSPKDVILKYSFKITGGEKTKLLPMIESGHHLRRVYFGQQGAKILVEHEETTIAENDFVLKTDTWYHVMLEIKDNEFLVRFQDGPTLYGNHVGVGAEFANYNIGITATNKGIMHIDNMTIWHAGEVQETWPTKKQAIITKSSR